MPKCRKKRIQRQVNKQKINAIYIFVPLILVLGVIPLIVQMQLVPLVADVRAFWTQDSAADFFSYYKSKALILVVIYMLCVFGYYRANRVNTAVAPKYRYSDLFCNSLSFSPCAL